MTDVELQLVTIKTVGKYGISDIWLSHKRREQISFGDSQRQQFMFN